MLYPTKGISELCKDMIRLMEESVTKDDSTVIAHDDKFHQFQCHCKAYTERTGKEVTVKEFYLIRACYSN